MGFIQPLLLSQGNYYLLLIIQGILNYDIWFSEVGKHDSFFNKKYDRYKSLTLLAIGLVCYLYISNNPSDSTYFYFSLFVLSFILPRYILPALGNKLLMNDQFTRFILQILILTIMDSYFIGLNTAKKIINNKEFTFTYNNFESQGNKKMLQYKYLGQAGDYYFFFSMDNKNKYIIDKGEIKNLKLWNHPKWGIKKIGNHR